ncbi:uncharacterized protein LOC134269388 [Saccostrea cucullata]|uniref:uncharacterized protein LOC134269388 n=1 Tax=Saccostrea cuccullata TaxID=36930 RepID=UPI002ED3691B
MIKSKLKAKENVSERLRSDSVCELTNVDKTNKNQAGYNKYDRQSSQRRSKRNYSKLYSHSEQSESKKTSYEGEVEETSDTSDVELGLNEELNIERNKRKNSAAVFENEDTSANVAMGAKKSSTEVRKYKTTSSSSNKLVKEASKGEGKFVCIASVHRTSPVADLIINVPVDLEKLDWTEEEEDDGKREKIQRQFLGSPIRIPEINGSRSSSEEDGGVEIISCDDNMDEESEEDRGVEVLSRDDKVDEESKEKGGKKQRSKSKKSHTKVTKNSSKEVIGHCDNVDHNKRDGTDLGISKSPNGKSGSLLSGEQDCQEGEKVIEDQEEDESLQVDETPVKEYDVESFSTLWPALSGGEGVSKARARHFSSMSTQSHKSNCSDLSAVFSPIKVDKDIQEERRSSRSSSRREILGDFENRKRKRLSEPASRKRRRR